MVRIHARQFVQYQELTKWLPNCVIARLWQFSGKFWIIGFVANLSHSVCFQPFPEEDKLYPQMKKKKVLRRKKDDLKVAESLLPEMRTLTDNAITFANTQDNQEALRRLAAATHFQSSAIGSLCLAIANYGRQCKIWRIEERLTHTLRPFWMDGCFFVNSAASQFVSIL